MLNVKDKKVLVLGLGISGYASAEFLAKQGASVKISEMSDTQEIRHRLKGLERYSVQNETGGHTPSFCSDAELCIISPGLDAAALHSAGVISPGTDLMGELELGFQFSKAPVIAVTGTNGKSTTTELIGRMISGSGRHTVVCGNIGNPLIGEVENLTENSIAVVEVSSFQLETIKDFKPVIAVLLNVSEDHYDRHKNYDNYIAEKFKIFKNQSENDWAVIHSSLSCHALTKTVNSRCIFFSAGDKCVSVGSDKGAEVILKEEEIPIKGTHNLENITCSAIVAGIMGVDVHCIRRAVMEFKSLSHRFETVCETGGIKFIDDSKATNIDATRRALESTDRKVVLIAGGRDKGGDYLSVLPLMKEKVKTMVLIGEAAGRIEEAFGGIVPVIKAGDMSEAVKMARENAEKGEAVMLSPMCSSFDMFSDYGERGEVFRREVERLNEV